jgi:hypothetical protein
MRWAVLVAVFPAFGFCESHRRTRGAVPCAAPDAIRACPSGVTAGTAELVVTISRLGNEGGRCALKSATWA